jgi:hypothetical protein
VAALFSDWSGRSFRRRRVEGRDSATISRDLTGDVVPVIGLCRFNIEVKKQKGFSFVALLENPAGSLFTKWYHQSTYDAQICGVSVQRVILPLVFFKPNPNKDLLAVPNIALEFLLRAGERLRGFEFSDFGQVTLPVRGTKNKTVVALELPPCSFCLWEEFHAKASPEQFFWE